MGERVPLGVAGSFLMIWAAMGVFGAITSAVNHAWGVAKQPTDAAAPISRNREDPIAKTLSQRSLRCRPADW